MSEKTSKSEALLNKVYDHLNTIDVSTLSLRELQDFLEVVQKGRFLETIGQTSPFYENIFNGRYSSIQESESKSSE